MAIYDNAFKKIMLGTGASVPGVTNEFLYVASGDTLANVASLGPGYIAILNPATYTTVNPSVYTGNFIVANTSLFTQDAFGSHGGYQVPDLSKMVNPNLMANIFLLNAAQPFPHVFTIGANDTMTNPLECTPKFYCDETYFLRIDLKGSPILRAMSKNLYRMIAVKTECCGQQGQTVVDPTTVMIQFAEEILKDPYLSQFILPIVFSDGSATYPNPINYIAPASFGITYPTFVTASNTWDTYAMDPSTTPDNVSAGLILIAAYTDTMFSSCSFEAENFYDINPIQIIASFVDVHGNPCDSLKYCTQVLHNGFQGSGLGFHIRKDLVTYQRYLQNYVPSDARIREATGGDGVVSALNPNNYYFRLGFTHTIPRYLGGVAAANNVYNSDRYVIEIVTNSDPSIPGNGINTLQTFLTTNSGLTVYNVPVGTEAPITIS